MLTITDWDVLYAQNKKWDGFLAKTLIYITSAIICPAGKRRFGIA
jgi:hypothetical protein